MNAPATAAVPSINPATKPGHVLIQGRCQQVRKAGQSMLHLVTLPAPDEYSSPATVEIIASSRFADGGEDVKVLCRIGGYRRTYDARDPDTGDKRHVVTADNKLFAVLG